MALEKIIVPLDFTKGVDRLEDDYLSLPTKLNLLTNGEFVAKTSIAQREGWQTNLGTSVIKSTDEAPDTPRAMNALGADVVVESKSGFHAGSVLGATGKWRQIATACNRGHAELMGIFHGEDNVIESDVAGDADTQVVVYTTSNGDDDNASVYAAVIDGGQIVRNERIDAAPTVGANYNAISPRVCFDPSARRFFVYWLQYDNNVGPVYSIRGTSFTAANPGAALTITSIKADAAASCNIDACWHPYATSSAGAVLLAYQTTAAGQTVNCLKLSKSNGVTIVTEAAVNTALGHNLTCIRVVATSLVASSRPGFFAFAHSSTAADGISFTCADLDNAAPAATNSNLVGVNPTGKMSVMTDPNSTIHFWLAWEEGTAGKTNMNIKMLMEKCTAFTPTFSTVGGFAVGTGNVRSVGIASDLHYRNRNVYIGAVHYSLEQAAHFEVEVGRTSPTPSQILAAADRDIACRINFNGGFLYDTTFGGLVQSNYSSVPSHAPAQIPHVIQLTNSVITTKQRANGDRVTVRGVDVTPLGVDMMTLDWASQLNAVEVSKSLVLAGSAPGFYDGDSLTELGFLQYPESEDITATVSGGTGSLADGTYGITCLFEWTDRNGNKHQSRPATPKNAVVDHIAGAFANNTGTILIVPPTLRVTRKADVKVIIYVTDVNGSVYYRLEGRNLPLGLINDRTADTISTGVTFNAVSVGGFSVTAGEQLYTTGSVLSNAPYPGCKHVAYTQDRLFFSGCDDALIRYTEARTQAFFPGTNEVYVFETDTALGRVSAVKGLDDKVIVLQEKQIGAIFGRGPNRLGLQNEYSNVERLLAGYGHSWDNSNACCVDPNGVWFYDPNIGLRHINRGLALSVDQEGVQLGSQVDALVTNPNTGFVFEQKKQVRFCNTGASQSYVFVFDLEHAQWSVFSAGNNFVKVLDIAATAGVFCILDQNDGTVVTEGSLNLVDHTTAGGDNTIAFGVQTSWIKLAGIQGYQRVSKLLLLGTFEGTPVSHTDSVSILTNVNYQTASADAPSAFTYDPSVVTTPLQLEHQVIYQKCESIRIFISVAAQGARVRLSNLSLQIGVKKGTYKTAASARF